MQELNKKLNKINNIKGQIKNSIVNKKGTITDQTPFEDYPKAIDELPSGEGGEKVYAHYVDTNIEAGKKVLLTKVTNPVTPDSEFCNGLVPFVISNGIAYGYTTSSQGAGGSTIAYNAPIANGMIGSNRTQSGGISWGSYNNIQIRHSCNGGKNGISCLYSNENDGFMFDSIRNWCNGVGSYKSVYGRMRSFFTEHYVFNGSPYYGSSSYTGLSAYKFNDDSIEETVLTDSSINSGYKYISGYQGFIFEREEDNGSCVYWIRSKSETNFDEVVFEKYVFETGTFETLTTPYFKGSALSNTKTRFFQTKDYRYIIHKNGYVFLNYFNALTSPNSDGIIIKEFPNQIKTAMGDRTVTGIQVFYDDCFALMLNDGATLMCKYGWDLVPADKATSAMANGGDYLNVCDVEEVEPFKVADSDTVYQRAFSENRDFWYLTMQGVSKISLDMNPAGQFEKENITNSYFAFEPSSVRFNSTVLTGFMTGESKTEDGRRQVEVSTVTG